MTSLVFGLATWAKGGEIWLKAISDFCGIKGPLVVFEWFLVATKENQIVMGPCWHCKELLGPARLESALWLFLIKNAEEGARCT